MFFFRSPFLQRVPGVPNHLPASALTRRLIGPVLVLMLVGLPVLLIDSRALEPQGPGFFLYWIHDHLWLPFWGQAYTRFFPWSLAFWIPLLLGLGLWLFSYLSFISLIQKPQALLTNLAVGNKIFHPYLLFSEVYLQHWGGPSRLLAATLRRRFREGFLRLAADCSFEGATRQRRRLVRYCLLDLELVKKTGRSPDEAFDTLLLYSQNLILLLEHRLNDPTRTGEPVENQHLGQALPGLFGLTAPAVSEEHHRPGLHWASLMNSLQLATALIHPPTAVALFGPDLASNPDRLEKAVFQQMAWHLNLRRAEVIQATAAIERAFLCQTLVSASETRNFAGVDAREKLLAVQGQLATDLALMTAMVMGHPKYLLGWLDAIEALMLALNLETAGRPPRRRKDENHLLESKLQGLFGHLPRPTDFQFCQRLLARGQEDLEKQYRDSLFSDQAFHPSLPKITKGPTPGLLLVETATGPDQPGAPS